MYIHIYSNSYSQYIGELDGQEVIGYSGFKSGEGNGAISCISSI